MALKAEVYHMLAGFIRLCDDCEDAQPLKRNIAFNFLILLFK